MICESCSGETKRRRTCVYCGLKLCRSCMGSPAIPRAPMCWRCCAKRNPVMWWPDRCRCNERFHDTVIWAHGGVLFYGRLMHHGEPARESRSYRTGRRGVDAEYVDTQYHGGLED